MVTAVDPNKVNWAPKFVPPLLEIENTVINDISKSMRSTSIQLVEVNGKFAAKQTFRVDAEFYTPFELRNYPFGTVLFPFRSTATVLAIVTTHVLRGLANSFPYVIVRAHCRRREGRCMSHAHAQAKCNMQESGLDDHDVDESS